MTDFTKVKGMLVYVQCDKPVKAFQKAGADPKPDEYKASVVVTDEDWVDEYEAWLAEVDGKTSIKKVKKADFESIYKVAPPEDAGKNVWVLTFRKSSEQGKTGKKILPQHEPKIYERVKSTLVDITHTKLVANGSTGVISLSTWQRTNGGMSIDLAKILVLDLIEYVREDREEKTADEEFAEFLGNDAPKKEAAPAPSKPAPKVAAKAAKPAPQQNFDDMDDDIPF